MLQKLWLLLFMEYDPDNWPDEQPHRQNRGGHQEDYPFFTGPRSGKLNYAFCKQRPWSRYCDRKLRPNCYTKGRNPRAFPQWNGTCKKLKQPDTIEAPKWPGYPKKMKRSRKIYRRKGKRTYRKRQKRAAKRAPNINLVPDYKETVLDQFIINAVQNEKQHILGGNGLNLWTPYDIKNYTALTPTVNTANKVLLKGAKLTITMQNLAPNAVQITVWTFTPRQDSYAGKTPTEVYVQGIKDMNAGGSNEGNPISNPYQSKMFCEQFKIKRWGFIRLENGEEKTISFTANWNKMFNTEKLTTPGSTTFSPALNTNWNKGITMFYGLSCLGGLHDVTTAGTGGVTGVGYGPVKVGVLTRKVYTTQTITGTVTADQIVYPSTTVLGKAGTTSGAAAIQNEDTGTSIATFTAGVSVNQA